MMAFEALPACAAWRHETGRDGFEVVFTRSGPGGHGFEGTTTAVEDGVAWTVGYSIEVAPDWVTRRAHITRRGTAGHHEVSLESDGSGEWLVDGEPAPDVRGCLDLDLESSLVTNTVPVHRLSLPVGEGADAPAVFVRALDLRLERLDQRYERRADDGPRAQYDYVAPRFGYAGRLAYDPSGLLLTYPGLGARVL